MKQETVNMLIEFEEAPSIYGSFKQRVLATIIDGLVLLPLTVIDWFNKSDWKSQLLLTLVFIIGISYKVFLEYKFGATLGKMSMKLMVVNKELHRVNLNQVLIRNIFDIFSRIFFFIITLIIYRSEGFGEITSNHEYVTFSHKLFNTRLYLLVFTLIIIIEIIFILSDKKKRALHDRMANTFVIRTTNNRT